MLEEIGLAFIEINQDRLHVGCFGKNFSSPTLLKDNDIIIFGGKTDSQEGACTTNLSDKEELTNITNELTYFLQNIKKPCYSNYLFNLFSSVKLHALFSNIKKYFFNQKP